MTKKATNHMHTGTRKIAVVVACGLLASAAFAADADLANARFKGSGKADLARITNVAVKPAADGTCAVTFDLAWDWSWRAAWEEPPARAGGKDAIKLESWDAAWVFVKYRKPGGVWRHAALAADVAKHAVPVGAAMELGLNDESSTSFRTGGRKGVGAFIHRATLGQGPNDWRGVSLCWVPPTGAEDGEEIGSELTMQATPDKADKAAFDPAKAEVRVLALEMVYVPQGAFWLGDGATSGVAGQFSAGAGAAPFRVESEKAVALGGETPDFLNNRDNIGIFFGAQDDFNSDQPRTLPAAFPKGYAAFYCMRYEVTQKMYVEYLNSASFERQAKSVHVSPTKPAATLVLGTQYQSPRNGVRIQTPGVAGSNVAIRVQREGLTMTGSMAIPGSPAVFTTDNPFSPCHFVPYHGALGFAAWAGLRPMTELEYEKACRGPLKPVAGEFPWGTPELATDCAYVLTDVNQETESISWTGESGPDATRGNVVNPHTIDKIDGPQRVGIFATPQSDRALAGASYWGILDLAGGVSERVVPVGEAVSRVFDGTHGEGDEPVWGNISIGQRGGAFGNGQGHSGAWSSIHLFRVSDRTIILKERDSSNRGHCFEGMRCVRTSPLKIED